MRNILIILILGALFSCENKRVRSKKIEAIPVTLDSSLADGFTDFFEISQKSFEQYKTKDFNWFISNDGQSKLYIVPYTDYSITTAILTDEMPIDTNLVNLLKWEGVKIGDDRSAIKVNRLISQKGIELGLSMTEVKSIFGMPKSEIQLDSGTKLVWVFQMKEDSSDFKWGGLRPFILDGLKFKSEMFFNSENKLTQLVYQYQVP